MKSSPQPFLCWAAATILLCPGCGGETALVLAAAGPALTNRAAVLSSA